MTVDRPGRGQAIATRMKMVGRYARDRDKARGRARQAAGIVVRATAGASKTGGGEICRNSADLFCL